jgi:hypothetical protein
MWYLTIFTATIGWAVLCISMFQSQPMQKYLTVGALPIFFLSAHLFSIAKYEWIHRSENEWIQNSMLETGNSLQGMTVLVFMLLCQCGLLALYVFLDARHGKRMQKRVLMAYINLIKILPHQRR